MRSAGSVRPLLSILIPTRNRAALARLAVEAALAGSDQDCEVVVADNNDVALELLSADHRLRHLKPEGVLSMPDNWERAVKAAKGEWLMLLADKHMLVPGAITLLRALVSRGHPVVTYGYGVLRQSISPPDDADLNALRSRGGRLQIPARVTCEVRDSRKALLELHAKAQYPRDYPMLYTALIHRSIIEACQRRTGRFFLGPCPDVCSATQILSESQTYISTQAPAAMIQYPNDAPDWSTGASQLAGSERARRFYEELETGGWVGGTIARLVAGVIFETQLEVASRREDGTPAPSWVEFAKAASREIEAHPPARRPLLHAKLLRYTQRSRWRPRAAYAQLQAALAVHLPRGLADPLLSLRARFAKTSQAWARDLEVSAVLEQEVATRDQAFERLTAALLATAVLY